MTSYPINNKLKLVTGSALRLTNIIIEFQKEWRAQNAQPFCGHKMHLSGAKTGLRFLGAFADTAKRFGILSYLNVGWGAVVNCK